MFLNLFHGLREATETWQLLNSYPADYKVTLEGLDAAMRALGH